MIEFIVKVIIVFAFCSFISWLGYLKGYVEGYDDAKETYTRFYDKLREIEKETYELELKYYENRN